MNNNQKLCINCKYYKSKRIIFLECEPICTHPKSGNYSQIDGKFLGHFTCERMRFGTWASKDSPRCIEGSLRVEKAAK